MTDGFFVPRRNIGRRSADHWRAWLPLVLSIASMLVQFGVSYGVIRGEFKTIDFRLRTIERVLKIGP